MRKNLIISFGVCVAAFNLCIAQNSNIPWSNVNAGVGRTTAPQFLLTASYGQALVGKAVAGNTVLESGFLATRLLRGPTTEIPDQPSSDLPTEFNLSQNFPNPFNPSTTIRYQLPVQSHVTLNVYDVLGREVAVLADELQEPGTKSVILNADRLASGTYFYRFQARPTDGKSGSLTVETKKLLLMK